MASVIVCWTLFALGLGTTATAIVSSFSTLNNFNMRQRFSHTIAGVRTDGTTPTTVPGYEVRFDGELEYTYGSPVSGGTLTLTVRPDSGPSATIDIDPAAGSWTIPSTGESGPDFDRSAAIKVLGVAGIDTSPTYVNFEAGELADAVRLVRNDPETAIYSVLGTHMQHTTTTHHQHTPATTWYPSHLIVTSQSGDSASTLRFDYESDPVDSNYTGASSSVFYDGRIALDFTTAPPPQSNASAPAGGPTLATVTLTAQPPVGHPAELVYDLTAGTATITRGPDSEQFQPATDRDAIERFVATTGLTGTDGPMDPGLKDILDLVEQVRATPTLHDQQSNPMAHVPNTGRPGNATANPAGDGEPDGGFVESKPATQNWMPSSNAYQSGFPTGILVTIGVNFLLYLGGVAFIIIRRFKIYPEQLVGPQGPPGLGAPVQQWQPREQPAPIQHPADKSDPTK